MTNFRFILSAVFCLIVWVESKEDSRLLHRKKVAAQQQWIVEIDAGLALSEKEQIESSLGVRLSVGVAPNTYLVVSSEDLRYKQRALKIAHVRAIHPRKFAHVNLENLEISKGEAELRNEGGGGGGQGRAELWVLLISRDVWQDRPSAQELVSSSFGPYFSQRPISVLAVSEDKIIVRCDQDDVSDVARWISARPEVHWVEAKPNFKLHNKYARSILLNGPNVPFVTAVNGNAYWKAGLTGSGQLVGVADTGVDYDNCFFFDPALDPPTNKIDLRVRKVVGIFNYSGSNCGFQNNVQCGDNLDLDGHGTHVAGSVCGDPLSPIQAETDAAAPFSGMAQKAQLVFTDIAVGSNLAVPVDVENGLFPDPYNAGVRIHSNSWGSPSNTYTTTCLEMDSFMWKRKDFLILVAVGNDGSSGDSTVGSPATAKNVLAVGAAQNRFDSYNDVTNANGNAVCSITLPSNVKSPSCCRFLNCTVNDCCPWVPACCASFLQATGYNENNTAAFSSKGPIFLGGISSRIRFKPDVVAPGEHIASAFADGRLYPLGRSVSQCTIPSVSRPFSPTSSMTLLSGTSMATPIVAGLLAIIRQYYVEGWYPTNTKVASNAFSPSAALMKATVIAASQPLKALGHTFESTQSLTLGYYQLLTSNAFGTTRMIVCYTSAGTWISSFFNGNNIAVFSAAFGTANEITCTDAAVFTNTQTISSVSQNCTIPQIAVSDDRSFTCSTGTAIFSVSCGTCQVPKTYAPSWNKYQGFGMPILTSVLPLSDASYTLFADDSQSFTSTGMVQYTLYKASATLARPLSIVLVWTDPPGENLINDLDLSVSIDDGPVMLGNGEVLGGNTVDTTNTVERVVIKQLRTAGRININVTARVLTQGPQPFALVCVGNFQMSNSGLQPYQIVLMAVLIPVFFILAVIIVVFVLKQKPPPPPPPPRSIPPPPPVIPKPSPPVVLPPPPASPPPPMRLNGPLPAHYLDNNSPVLQPTSPRSPVITESPRQNAGVFHSIAYLVPGIPVSTLATYENNGVVYHLATPSHSPPAAAVPSQHLISSSSPPTYITTTASSSSPVRLATMNNGGNLVSYGNFVSASSPPRGNVIITTTANNNNNNNNNNTSPPSLSTYQVPSNRVTYFNNSLDFDDVGVC